MSAAVILTLFNYGDSVTPLIATCLPWQVKGKCNWAYYPLRSIEDFFVETQIRVFRVRVKLFLY